MSKTDSKIWKRFIDLNKYTLHTGNRGARCGTNTLNHNRKPVVICNTAHGRGRLKP